MTREEAYDFIRLYKKFSELACVKIVGYGEGIVEIEVRDQNGFPDRHWWNDWMAAEVIADKS